MPDDASYIRKAVALQYVEGQDAAPRIIASGKGIVAEQIIALAEKNGIIVSENTDLVDILSVLDIDDMIPIEAYLTVAEILSYIYKQKKRQ